MSHKVDFDNISDYRIAVDGKNGYDLLELTSDTGLSGGSCVFVNMSDKREHMLNDEFTVIRSKVDNLVNRLRNDGYSPIVVAIRHDAESWDRAVGITESPGVNTWWPVILVKK